MEVRLPLFEVHAELVTPGRNPVIGIVQLTAEDPEVARTDGVEALKTAYARTRGAPVTVIGSEVEELGHDTHHLGIQVARILEN